MIGIDNDLATYKNPAEKTISHCHAEKSLCSTMSFILTVGASHFMMGSPPKGHPCHQRKGTEGAKTFYRMVKTGYKRVYNVEDVYPVHPLLLTSTNDKTIYIHK
eukprot:10867512-Ditylum_brightwellii.AAC.1